MKRVWPGIVLLVLGALLVAMAPVWLWGIGPLFVELPADLEVITEYTGTLTLYADQVTSRFYPPGSEVVVPLEIHAEDRAVPSEVDPGLVVVQEKVTVKDAASGKAMPGVRPDAVYVLDRRTCANVPGVIEGIDRDGYSLTFPIGTRKRSYPVWDDELGRCVSYEFEGVKRMDGEKSKGIEVYIFSTPGEMEKMEVPPPGLPASVSGKTVKEMSGRPDLPISDDARLTLEYFKKMESTQYVEPRTGLVVFVPKHHYEYYVKNAPGMTPQYLRLASVEYSRKGANARSELDSAAKYFGPLDLDQKWVPLGFLVSGVIFILAGAVLLVWARTPRKPEDS